MTDTVYSNLPAAHTNSYSDDTPVNCTHESSVIKNGCFVCFVLLMNANMSETVMGIKQFCNFVFNHTSVSYVNIWSLPPPNVHPLQRHFITQKTENLSEN